MKVIKSELDYTGGGIWCAWGELEDGTIFMAASDVFYLSIYEHDILKAVEEENEWLEEDDFATLYDLDGHTCEEYFIKDADIDDVYDIWCQVLEQNRDCGFATEIHGWLDSWYERETGKPFNVQIEFTSSELDVLNKVLADKSYLPEVEPIFEKVHSEYVNAQE